ncbi:FecR domain-containing protein [Pseudomonas ovata]|uniref:FecR domain-containing protein n=1 Tax=Pseudomonas ovata TaxID=1839709 RepID=UPI000D69EEA0|nr:FecR domain-containing protein [Pseudomonas ovata]
MSRVPDFQTLEAAAAWYVQLNDGEIDEARILAWQQWLQASPQHAAAWERVERLHQQWARVPQQTASSRLSAAQRPRREVLKVLSILLAMGGAGWLAVEHVPYRALLAQQHTRGNQRRTLELQDGSRLVLNADTAVDIRFSALQRLIQLHQGEVLVQTAQDAARRPFIVQSEEGSILALGTRFSVRQLLGKTRVGVLDAAVQVRPLQSIHHADRLVAGQQVTFDCNRVSPPEHLPEGSTAWVQGLLSVNDWPLGTFLDELSRYRPGVLRCDESIRHLRISGTFALDDIDTVLENLGKTLPVKVRYLTRYWTRVEPA